MGPLTDLIDVATLKLGIEHHEAGSVLGHVWLLLTSHFSRAAETKHPVDLISLEWQMVSLVFLSIDELFVPRPSDFIKIKILSSPVVLVFPGLLILLEVEFVAPAAILTTVSTIRMIRDSQTTRAISNGLISS